MSRTLLIACSVILVIVLFFPIIVWSQTASIFVVRGTVKDSNGELADNGLAVIVRNATTDVTLYAVTGGVSNAYLLPKNIIVGRGQFAVVFPPFESNRAAAVGDKIEIHVSYPPYEGKTFSYTVAQSNIISPEYGEMEIIIPYYTFTLRLDKGINLISIPLAEATAEDEKGEIVKDEKGEPVRIKKVSDLRKSLGDSWSLITSFNCKKGFQSYQRSTPEEAPLNIDIDGYTGLIVVMKEARTLKLIGKGWPEGDMVLTSECFNRINMIGIPLKDNKLEKVSDLGELLGGTWNLIIIFNRKESKFQSYQRSTPKEAPLNIVINGDTGLIVVMRSDKKISVTGEPWSDENRRIPLK